MSLFVFMIPTAMLTVIVGVILVILSAVNKEAEKKFTALNVAVETFHFLLLTSFALAVTQIGFAATEKWIPDLLIDNAWSMQSSIESARYALAGLIIIAPLYLLVLRKTRGAAGVWMQKFMAGAAVLVAGGVAFSTLIALVYNFISGDVGLRLVAQMLILLLVSGGIAAYYQLFLRSNVRNLARITNFFTIKAAGVAVFAIVVGFMISGGPGNARAERFDDKRLTDLSGLQWQLQMYFEQNHAMPKKLLELHDPINNYALPADPRTNAAYEYRVVRESLETTEGGTRRAVAEFELCAAFETERTIVSGSDAYAEPVKTSSYIGSDDTGFLPSYYRGDMSPHWNHGIGKECFSRTIKRTESTPVPVPAIQTEVLVQ